MSKWEFTKQRESGYFNLMLLTIMLAVFSAVFLNQAISLSGLKQLSAGYAEVNTVIGEHSLMQNIIKAGILVPVLEELIFRGLIYASVKSLIFKCGGGYKSAVITGGIVSALVFGGYHGNLVQFVYAFLMGIIITYVFESGMAVALNASNVAGLLLAIVFHISANSFVLLMRENTLLMHPAGRIISCGLGLAGTIGLVLLIRRLAFGKDDK